MESEHHFRESEQNPSILYHGSRNIELDLLKPGVKNSNDPGYRPDIFATPDVRLAAIFMNNIHRNGFMDGQPYAIIEKSKEHFTWDDKGGAIYSFGPEGFSRDPENDTPVYINPNAVQPESKIAYKSGLDAMLENGVRVYFADQAAVKKLHELDAPGREDEYTEFVRSLKPYERGPQEDLASRIKNRLEQSKDRFSEQDFEKINKSITLALDLHEEQKARPDGPYVLQILTVVDTLVNYFKVKKADVIMAGALHDSVEDQASIRIPKGERSQREVALEYIKDEFSPRTSELVHAVTNAEELDNLKGEDLRREYVAHVKEAIQDPDACLVKLADFMGNGLNIRNIQDPKWQRNLAKKYLPLYSAFIERISQDDVELDPEVKNEVTIRLSAVREFAESLLAA